MVNNKSVETKIMHHLCNSHNHNLNQRFNFVDCGGGVLVVVNDKARSMYKLRIEGMIIRDTRKITKEQFNRFKL